MTDTTDTIREEVRQRYGEAALAVEAGSGCGSGSCCGDVQNAAFGELLYEADERAEERRRGLGLRLRQSGSSERGATRDRRSRDPDSHLHIDVCQCIDRCRCVSRALELELLLDPRLEFRDRRQRVLEVGDLRAQRPLVVPP